MKTIIFRPAFFLVSKEFVIKVDRKITIGRSKGEIILEDDTLLSEAHCEVEIENLHFYVKDLYSTNGVYHNRAKIEPGVRLLVNTGDILKIGAEEYTVYDSEETVKEVTKTNRRKHPRPASAFSIINLLNFYSAPVWTRVIYGLLILAAVTSSFLNMHLDIPVPSELSFLTKLYNDQILVGSLKMVFMVWAACIIHSFAIYVYFNRNPLRQIGSFIVFGVVLFNLVDFRDGPLGGVRRYVTERDAIQNLQFNEKAIVHLKNVVEHQNQITKAHKFTQKRLPEEEQVILKADFDLNVTRINEEMEKIDKSKEIK